MITVPRSIRIILEVLNFFEKCSMVRLSKGGDSMEQIKPEFNNRYEQVLATVEANSPYGRKAPAEKKWMTVPVLWR